MNFYRDFIKKLYFRHAAGDSDPQAMNLDNWAGQYFGRYLLRCEQNMLGRGCGELAGYRLMHLGVSGDGSGLEPFKQLHQFYIRPSAQPLQFESSSAVGAYAELPLPSEVVDVAVLQHALEYSASPQAVLAETARVLAPGGHLILCVINPLGPIGLIKSLMGLFLRRPEYGFHSLRKRRVYDWLSLLNFQVVGVNNGAYNLPLERPDWLQKDSVWEQTCQKIHFPLGNFYMIHAVKRVAGGIRNTAPAWRAVGEQ